MKRTNQNGIVMGEAISGESQSKRKTAAVIFSLNRHDYLKEALHSLENNIELDDIDFYFFQDGAINVFSKRIAAEVEDIDKCVNIWKETKLPNKTLVRMEGNVGIGIIQFKAKELLFEKLGYQRVMFFENDLVLSCYYLRLLKILLEQFRDDRQVGAVMCHGADGPPLSREEKLKLLYKLDTGRSHLWGWATWSDRWELIKPTFLRYYEFIKDLDYRTRSDTDIFRMYVREHMMVYGTSQDCAMYYAMFKNGMFILNTQVNRAKYIGAKGEHMVPELFERSYLSKRRLDEFEEDATCLQFEEYDKKEFIRKNEVLFDLNKGEF